jgi:hypothetical protein
MSVASAAMLVEARDIGVEVNLPCDGRLTRACEAGHTPGKSCISEGDDSPCGEAGKGRRTRWQAENRSKVRQ